MLTVVAAVTEREGRVMICQRRPEVHNGMKWEFPGGKLEPGEGPEAALARELKEELGIDVDINDRESFRTRFETEYLIWANDAAKEILGNDFVGEGPTISPHYLMNLVFEQCGFEGPAYMQAMSDIMETLNVVTSNNFLMVGETLIAENELSKEQEELYRQYLYLQHYWRNEFQYKDLK